ncbi:nuclear protein [Coprinopsis cinerea AmutBmut pab1-1]|nr:nuclear protein [Coprinopsis cinerea AmutBmut pab1-1]
MYARNQSSKEAYVRGGATNQHASPSLGREAEDNGGLLAYSAFQLVERSLSVEASTSFIQSTAPMTEENDLSDPDDLSHVTLAERLKNLSLDITENRFFGRSSMFLYAQNCIEFKNERSGTHGGNFARTKRPVFWELREWEKDYLRMKDFNYVFPEPDLLESLISLYFDNCHILLPVLHRPTFENDVRNQLHLRNPSFAATLLTVCALASRFSTDPRVYLKDADQTSSGWKYISQVPLASTISLVQTTVYDLQRYALAAMYFLGSSMNHTAWTLAGIGLRLAQDGGLHRRQRNKYRPNKEAELRKRAFWCLVAMDRTMSSLLGRPCALYGEDIDVDYPVECDDEYWETEDPTQAFRQPPDRPSFMSAFLSYLGLCDIIGSMLRTLYSTKKCRIIHGLIGENWEVRVVAELDSALVTWRRSLPRHLQWNPEISDRTFFQQSLFLNTFFCYVRIQIHRPLLRNDCLSTTPFIVCREVSTECAHLLQAASVRGGLTDPHIVMAAFASALTLIIDLWAEREFISPDEVARYNTNIESCVTYIKRSENRWPGSARMGDMLAEFRSVRSVHVEGDKVEASQSSMSSTSHSHQQGQPSNLSIYGDTLLGSYPSVTALSTPSPPGPSKAQDQVTAPLNVSQLPTDTPFNFDFSHIQTSPGSNVIVPQYSGMNQQDVALFNNPGSNHGSGPTSPDAQFQSLFADPSTTLWSQAPVAYSIEEWDNYIMSLERMNGQLTSTGNG